MVLVQKANKLSILKIEQYRPLLSIGMICFQMINKACFSALPPSPCGLLQLQTETIDRAL